MPERLPINSASLKERFPEVYREFFSKCALVCSAPRSVSLAGEHWDILKGGIEIRQPLPVRTYVGIVPIVKPEVYIARYLTFDHVQNSFIERPVDNLGDQGNQIKKFFRSFFEEEFSTTLRSGFEIHVLSELPLELSHGGMKGSFIAAFIASVMVYCRVLTVPVIDKWRSSKTAVLFKDKALQFDRFFSILHKWETRFYYKSGGVQIFASALPSSTPVLFASFLRPETAKNATHPRRQFWYWGARAEEALASCKGWPLACDWGMISTGEIQIPLASLTSFAEVKKHVEIIVRKAVNLMGELGLDAWMRYSVLNDLFPMLKHPEEAWRYFDGGKSILEWEALLIFRDLIENGYSEKRMRALAGSLNKAQSFFTPLELTTPTIEKIIAVFRSTISQYLDPDFVGIRMRALATRNSIFFIAPPGALRPYVDELLEVLRKQVGNDKISLDYASWIDGYDEEGGVKIEQWLEQGIHSPLLAVDSLRLTRRTSRGKVETKIIDPGKVACEKFDLYLDLPHGKLYVAGKECTSKEIPSQKATVAILDALLSAEGHRLHNRALPESGYTKYRNEFQGKITGPLVALVKKRLKKDLDLKVEGTLTDFWVSLDPKGFEIGVVKKLG